MRRIWLKNFTADDLLTYYDRCMRDASLEQLSSHGRFVAARDAIVACAAIALDFDGSRDAPCEVLLLRFSEHECIERALGREITKLGFDSADYSLGFTLADETAAQRAYQCALAAHAATLSWLRKTSRNR